ncbi:hypothetical protein [Mycobacterium sp.]|nr:hypothetical protein [Mycobacterium sp.]MBW0011867.1 hypothetical protein [Mycobacterium sp.]
MTAKSLANDLAALCGIAMAGAGAAGVTFPAAVDHTAAVINAARLHA